MKVLLILGVLLPTIVLLWWFRRMRGKYVPLLSDSHLFEELPALAVRLEAAALERVGEDLESSDDPRLGVTSAGLTMMYTAEELPPGLSNHLSCSFRGGPIAFAFGGRCAYVLLTALGIDPAEAAVAHSATGILHLAFLTDPAQRAAYAGQLSAGLSPEEVETAKGEASAWMTEKLRSSTVLRSEEELLPELLRTS